MNKSIFTSIVVVCVLLLAACNSSDAETSDDATADNETSTEATNNDEESQEENNTPEKPTTPPTNAEEMKELLVGTWTYSKATVQGNDQTSAYPYGYQNGEKMKMTLNADGTVSYDSAVMDALNIKSATWSIEKHDTKDFYYFVTEVQSNGGKATSREKIRTATNETFLFGKGLQVEYVR
ncbi:MAG: hypothetical protein NXI10_16180 [bacterium]|nr:hypothetical protein [bacterium]